MRKKKIHRLTWKLISCVKSFVMFYLYNKAFLKKISLTDIRMVWESIVLEYRCSHDLIIHMINHARFRSSLGIPFLSPVYLTCNSKSNLKAKDKNNQILYSKDCLSKTENHGFITTGHGAKIYFLPLHCTTRPDKHGRVVLVTCKKVH